MREVYLDYAAATPILPAVKKYMCDLLDLYGNPNALHKQGEKIENIIESSRKQVAEAVNCQPEQVFFTNSASEANQLFHSMYPNCKIHSTSHDSMFTFKSEHPKGSYSYEWVNNETGNVYPQLEEEDYSLINENNIIHIDASQALRSFELDLRKVVYWDYVTISSPKILGPPGAAALIAKDPNTVKEHLKDEHESTPNWLSIAGFGMACECLQTNYQDKSRQHKLQILLMDLLEKEIPNLEYNSAINGSVFDILNIYLPDVEGESLVMRCSERGVYFSTGSACAAKDIKPSHVITSMFNGDAERAHGSIRLSFGLFTDEDDIRYAAEVISSEYKKLKEMSTSNYRRK